MGFPTVRDCLGLRGFERDLLHDLDRRLREEIVRTGSEASNFDIGGGNYGITNYGITNYELRITELRRQDTNSPISRARPCLIRTRR